MKIDIKKMLFSFLLILTVCSYTFAAGQKEAEAEEAEVKVQTLILTAHASWINGGMEALVEYVNSKSSETGAIIELDLPM
ncbi:MAG: hypothetical protein OCD02_19605 [Spirochaetaceae bacterium]